MHLAFTLRKYLTIVLLLLITCHATINNYFKHEQVSVCFDTTEKDDTGGKEEKADKEYQAPTTVAIANSSTEHFYLTHIVTEILHPVIDSYTPPPDKSV